MILNARTDIDATWSSIAPGARASFAYARTMVLCLAVWILHICDGRWATRINLANASSTPQTNQQVHLFASTTPRAATRENVRWRERNTSLDMAVCVYGGMRSDHIAAFLGGGDC